MRRLLDDPTDYINLIRRYGTSYVQHVSVHILIGAVLFHFCHRYAGGLTLFVVYGHEVKSNDDKFLSMAEKCVWVLSNRIASSGGIWPVDIFPFLKYIPAWLPGMGFKRNAKKWKAQMEEFVDKPYELVRDNIVRVTRLFQGSTIGPE